LSAEGGSELIAGRIEAAFDILEDVGVLAEGYGSEFGESLAGDVVVGGAHAAGDDDEVGFSGGKAEGVGDIVATVIDGDGASAAEAEGGEGAGEEVSVAVGVSAGEEFVAGDDNEVVDDGPGGGRGGESGGWPKEQGQEGEQGRGVVDSESDCERFGVHGFSLS